MLPEPVPLVGVAESHAPEAVTEKVRLLPVVTAMFCDAGAVPFSV